MSNSDEESDGYVIPRSDGEKEPVSCPCVDYSQQQISPPAFAGVGNDMTRFHAMIATT